LQPYRTKRVDASRDLCHFYLDDYRFEMTWNKPNAAFIHLRRYWAVMTPDFSLYPQWPTVVNQWNTYGSGWWQSQGLRVIPTVNWSDEASHAYCFDGIPTGQSFHGHPVDGALVTWVDSTSLPGRYEAFLRAHGNPHGVDMAGLGDPWLMVAIHNPLDDKPSVNPTMLRGAFNPSQISDFINREAIEHAGGRAAPLADEESMILRDVVRYVLSLGMYLSAYPEALSSGVPGWMNNKHLEGRKGVPFTQIGVDRKDRELQVAMTVPHSVLPYWQQLRDARFYCGKWASHCPGSRYVLVNGYEVGAGKTVGVEPVEP
jgi:hypothetical protein